MSVVETKGRCVASSWRLGSRPVLNPISPKSLNYVFIYLLLCFLAVGTLSEKKNPNIAPLKGRVRTYLLLKAS